MELLRSGAGRPDAAITLELHDDVAWEQEGTPTQLLQVKHHQNTHRVLTDASTDMWRTLKVWMDTARPGDTDGPELVLVTTQVAGAGMAVAALRPDTRDDQAALRALEAVASTSTSAETKTAREQFLGLSASERNTFISRIRVLDGSVRIEEVPAAVRGCLQWALPIGHEDLFLALVWRWWDDQALAMLQGRLRSLDVGAAQSAISDIRDQFHAERLPTLVELADVDVDVVTAEHRTHIFVQQMQWVCFPPVNLQKAIVDYYRAYTQAVRWVDEDLIGLAELAKFEAELKDEWEREFEWMVETLDGDADDTVKEKAGRTMLRQLLTQTGIAIRARYSEPFFSRGQRHMLADSGRIGWHPDFESRIQHLLQVAS
ncbi:hypothetical protein MXD63_31895 [Frankia sp. Cpl3]|nr:hypothetical protein [Frankia sp. Cpl3]